MTIIPHKPHPPTYCGICKHNKKAKGIPGEDFYPESIAVATKSVPDCVHRGNQVSLEQCTSCRGNVKNKVYSCSLYGTCTIKECAARQSNPS